jgi:hypothetical protein
VKLVSTENILADVKLSTPNMRPISKVKKPAKIQNNAHVAKEQNLPLMLERIVALAIVVYARAALIVQFAMNQKKQNTDASLAVSASVRGDNSATSPRTGGMSEGWRV